MANKFIIEIRTQGFNKATGDLDRLGDKADKFGKNSRKMRLHTEGLRREIGKLRNNLLLISFAFGAVAAAVNKTVAAYRKQLEAETRLRASLRNVATASADGADKLMQLAAALQQTTTFGDEQIISAQAMLATFQLNEDAIAALTPRMLDMATAMGTGGEGLTTIALQLGKAFTGQVGALSRSGVLIDKAGLAISRTQGPTAEFAFLVKELDKNFKGLAAELGDTTIGKIDQLKNEISDVNEELGKVSLPVQVFALEIKKSIIESLSWMVLFHEEARKAGGGMQLLEKIPGIIKAVNKSFEDLEIDLPEFGEGTVTENIEKIIAGLKDEAAMLRLIGIESGKAGITFIEANKLILPFFARQNILLRQKLALGVDIQTQEEINIARKKEGLDLTISQEAKIIELKIKEIQLDDIIAQAKTKSITSTMRGLSALMGMNKDLALASGRVAQAAALIDMYAGANKAFQQGGVLGFFTAAAIITAGLANVAQIESQISQMKSAATGADFTTSGPQILLVGDNPGGRERVQVSPLSSQNINGPQGGITINISAPLIDETVVESIIPAIQKAQRMNLA